MMMKLRLELMLLALALPACAQVDLSGEWNPLFHEDQPERIPGPERGGPTPAKLSKK
jgi:hypothetical protein